MSKEIYNFKYYIIFILINILDLIEIYSNIW